MERIESIILRSLIYNSDYMRRVLPFLDDKLFLDNTERTLFKKINAHIETYNDSPTPENLLVEIEKVGGISQELVNECKHYIHSIESEKDQKVHTEWLLDNTENWVKEASIHNAVLDVIGILNDKKSEKKGNIPKLLQDALAVSFDARIGHDFFEDSSDRYDFYHKKESKLPFHLDYFNKITKNGVSKKTLNIVMAGTGVGKSLCMCDFASNFLLQNQKLLYITLEMSEERISERIDANILDIPTDHIPFLSKDVYQEKLEKIKKKTQGQLIVKEYPSGSAHVGHFRHTLNEIWLKKGFKPDIIFVDYLGICAPFRTSKTAGMYEVGKAVSEELRGLAQEFDLPLFSAVQTNKNGWDNTDISMKDIAESASILHNSDFFFALIEDTKLAALNQLMVKVLKNRYGDKMMRNKETGNIMDRFLIGVDKSKMKLYNLDDSAQTLSNLNINADDEGIKKKSTSKKKTTETKESQSNLDDEIFDIDKASQKEDLVSDLYVPGAADKMYAAAGNKPKKVLKT